MDCRGFLLRLYSAGYRCGHTWGFSLTCCTALPRRTALHFVEEVRDGDEVGATAGANPARDEVFVERFERMVAGQRAHATEAQDGLGGGLRRVHR